MRLIWEIFDENHSRKLDKYEFFKFLRYLGVPKSSHDEIFNENDTNKNGLIEFDEFELYYKKLTDCSYLEKLFKQFAASDTITLDEFHKFNLEHQKESDFSICDSAFLMINIKEEESTKNAILKKLE